jgi:hypothetical protein
MAARHEILLMQQTYLLIVTAFAEVGISLLLLVSPSVPLALLFGVAEASAEVTTVARIAGAALLALGVACWLGRSDRSGSPRPGLLTGVLVYDVGAAVILGHAGLFVGLVGVALWPAVALHAVLAIWCGICLRDAEGRGKDQTER